MIVEKTADHEDLNEPDGYHHKQLEAGPEVDTAETVLQKGSVASLDHAQRVRQMDAASQILTDLFQRRLKRTTLCTFEDSI